MARRRGWRRRRNRRLAIAGAVALAAMVVFWSRVWPYVLAALALGCLVLLGRLGWRRLREVRRKEAVFQAEQRVRDANRTMQCIDALSGEDFERQVAVMFREGGCTDVERVGGRGDRGRDIGGRLPDGRSMVVQCKRFAAHRSVAGGDMQRLLGTRTDFGADVAIFVTNTRFTADAERYAREKGIIAIGRNLFATWLNGAPLTSVLETGGGGQGNRQHLKTWKKTYGKPEKRRQRAEPQG
ncbi:hypothetical protein GCM10009716_36980 [Streptomyces sodiiphilus]|uniref:Restriction endonuclease type IV Mrr domain-containing protein n=1 Tax=Streptomyces sodiiphilus TaxID=226217 RepID=A0ABN2PNL9_9ACTN